ncbi:MAG: DUF5615 family PIN-like protein [Elusimicrobia bacterium]|nr:DUF5615 family PIN-like protein [Elusimicrobiota bacterium]
MQFLVDENVAHSTVQFLRLLGHDVLDVKEEHWFGLPDDKLVRIARREQRIILTLDKDFGNILVFPPKQAVGVLLIDLRNPHPTAVNSLLKSFLKGKNDAFFRHKLFLLNEWQVRIRE